MAMRLAWSYRAPADARRGGRSGRPTGSGIVRDSIQIHSLRRPSVRLLKVDLDGLVDAEGQRERGQRLADPERAAPQAHEAAHVVSDRDDLADAVGRGERR